MNNTFEGNKEAGHEDESEPQRGTGIATREKWNNKAEFLLSCISLVVGFGNVWRFPFLALENGGGAFLVPYFIVLILIGKPMYYLELCLGQFSSRGPIEVWELSPALKGIGYGQAAANWAVSTYYVSLMGNCVFYFFASFNAELPWSSCGPWSSDTCVDAETNVTAIKRGTSAAEEYLVNEVLKVDFQGFRNGIGMPDLRLTLCLLLSWTVLFLVQACGIRSSGKAAYFTALFPYVVLITLLIRSVTLPGSINGVLYFVTPRWEKLLDVQVWFSAITQAMYSLAIGYGTVITLASYSDFRNNVYRDAIFISMADTATSLLSGVTTFAVLGHLADLLDLEVSEVLKGDGTSLAFISYPDALAKFTYVPQVFSALFFLMMFTLGLGSSVVVNNVLLTILKDRYTELATWKVTLGVCLVGFLSGVIYATPQGQHVLTLANYFSAGVPILLLLALEAVAVSWVYGLSRFTSDIYFMLGRSTGLFWKMCWGVLIPAFLVCVVVYSQMQAQVLTYGSYIFGNVATSVGITLSAVPVILVPIMFSLEVARRYKSSRNLLCALKGALTPSPKWGPKDAILRQEYNDLMASKQ